MEEAICEGGVWRCGLQHADLFQSERYPIIWEHHLTDLIVLRAHDKVYHNGNKQKSVRDFGSSREHLEHHLVKKLIHNAPFAVIMRDLTTRYLLLHHC